MFHILIIQAIREIDSRMSTSRFLTSSCGVHGLGGAGKKVLELESFDEIRVPDHAAVLDRDIGEVLVHLVDLLAALVERLLGTEDGSVGLHDTLHVVTDLGGGLGTVGVSGPVEVVDRLSAGVTLELLVRLTWREVFLDVVGTSTTEDDNVEQRVSTKTVGTVDRNTSGLTGGVETGDDLVLTVGVLGQDFAGVLGGDTTHVVVDSGKNGNGLLSDVNTGENGSGLRDTGKTLVENLRWQVRKLEVDVVLLGTDTTTLANLDGHGSRDDVTRGKILGGRGVSLHESLTLRVEEVSTFTTRTFGDQASSTVNTSRVELNKLEILEGKTGTRNHGHTVTSAGVGRGGGEVGTTVTTGGKDGLMGAEAVNRAVLHVEGGDTDTLAILHDQVKSEVLDEEVGVVAKRLTVEGVKHGVSSSVGGGGTSVSLATLAVVERLTTEGTLVDLAILGSGEGKTEVFELNDGTRSLTAHVVDGVLVTEPVGTLDGVVHVPSPVVLGHVTKSCVDTTLGGNGVRSGREKLGDTGSVKTGLSETESGAETGTTGTNNDSIVFVVNDRITLCGVERASGLLGAQRLGCDDTRCLGSGVEAGETL